MLQFAMGVFSDLPAFEMQWLAQQIDGISLLGSAYKVTAICSFTMATYCSASKSGSMASCCNGKLLHWTPYKRSRQCYQVHGMCNQFEQHLVLHCSTSDYVLSI